MHDSKDNDSFNIASLLLDYGVDPKLVDEKVNNQSWVG